MAAIDELDVRDLQCVVVLAETLNFTETARRLHMTQPGVTARINRVERNHSCKLFDRNKGIVRGTTHEGFVFVEGVKPILAHLGQLLGRVEDAHRAVSERLSISRSHHVDLLVLSSVVAAQSLSGTKIVLQAPCESDEEAIALLLSGKADAALVAWPIVDDDVAAIHLIHDSLMVVLPEGHPLRERSEIYVADLRNERIIGSRYQFPTPVREAFHAKCRTYGFIPECLSISASPAESAYLVDSGASPGITIITRQYAKGLTTSTAVIVPFAEGEISYEYGVAYRQADHRDGLNAFLQYLVESCRPMPSRRRKHRPIQ